MAGILLLTLYPFHFDFHRYTPGARSPIFLGDSAKISTPLDAFLNVLLFVPYGFGLAGLMRKYAKSPMRTALLALAAGALLSYAIEFLQFFIPERDSGWEDVLTNSTGALAGGIAFQLCGVPLLRFLGSCESAIEAFATKRSAAIALLLYFGAWFVLSARLQKETGLSDWEPDVSLVVGNSASGGSASAWKGKVYELEFWDRELPGDVAWKLTSPGSSGPSPDDSLADYDFSEAPPFRDRRRTLPDLDLVSPYAATDPSTPIWKGKSWVATRGPVSALTMEILKARRFSVRVRCEPAQVDRVFADIVSISRPGGPVDMEIRQEDADLAFWFRTPISSRRPRLTWQIPRVFAAGQPRDFIFSYDGSNLSISIDGKAWGQTYHLSPAARLAQWIRRAKTAELEGYRYMFYALIFFPTGCLLGIVWRKIGGRPVNVLLLTAIGIALPSVLLELILVQVGGQVISVGNIILAFTMGCAGGFWINVGRSASVLAAQPSAGSTAS